MRRSRGPSFSLSVPTFTRRRTVSALDEPDAEPSVPAAYNRSLCEDFYPAEIEDGKRSREVLVLIHEDGLAVLDSISDRVTAIYPYSFIQRFKFDGHKFVVFNGPEPVPIVFRVAVRAMHGLESSIYRILDRLGLKHTDRATGMLRQSIGVLTMYSKSGRTSCYFGKTNVIFERFLAVRSEADGDAEDITTANTSRSPAPVSPVTVPTAPHGGKGTADVCEKKTAQAAGGKDASTSANTVASSGEQAGLSLPPLNPQAGSERAFLALPNAEDQGDLSPPSAPEAGKMKSDDGSEGKTSEEYDMVELEDVCSRCGAPTHDCPVCGRNWSQLENTYKERTMALELKLVSAAEEIAVLTERLQRALRASPKKAPPEVRADPPVQSIAEAKPPTAPVSVSPPVCVQPPAAPPPQQPLLLMAAHPFVARNTDELSFKKGDMIEILGTARESGPHWLHGRLGDVDGLFPSNYMKPSFPPTIVVKIPELKLFSPGEYQLRVSIGAERRVSEWRTGSLISYPGKDTHFVFTLDQSSAEPPSLLVEVLSKGFLHSAVIGSTNIPITWQLLLDEELPYGIDGMGARMGVVCVCADPAQNISMAPSLVVHNTTPKSIRVKVFNERDPVLLMPIRGCSQILEPHQTWTWEPQAHNPPWRLRVHKNTPEAITFERTVTLGTAVISQDTSGALEIVFTEMAEAPMVEEPEDNASGNPEVKQILANPCTLPVVQRRHPLTADEWKGFQDHDGRFTDEKQRAARAAIFLGGIEEDLRKEVFPFLLNVHDWNHSHAERQAAMVEKRKKYETIKMQWETIEPRQAHRWTHFRQLRHAVQKDVTRTDTDTDFYAEGVSGENTSTTMLFNVLLTYGMYNMDLGYCQGMGDLLSPVLYLVREEVMAFWMFVGVMDRLGSNFELDQSGIMAHLSAARCVVAACDPDLSDTLARNGCDSFYFCYRWFLVAFKRECRFMDSFSIWEVWWSDSLTKHLHIFIAVAFLLSQRKIIIEQNMEMDELLMYWARHRIEDVSELLRRGHAWFIKVQNDLPQVLEEVKELLAPLYNLETRDFVDDF